MAKELKRQTSKNKFSENKYKYGNKHFSSNNFPKYLRCELTEEQRAADLLSPRDLSELQR